MLHERLPPHSLLLARDYHGNNAMACVFRSRIVIPQHVAAGSPQIWDLETREEADVFFTPIDRRDLAYSVDMTLVQGFASVLPPTLNQEITIVGYHGKKHTPFEIRAVVTECLPNERVIVDRIAGAIPQPGMSGSPGVTCDGRNIIGILVEGVRNTNGQRLYLETLEPLKLIKASP